MKRNNIRNLCIIAHVDHGKTTLVDGLLGQSGLFAAHEKPVERVMDSNDLERERGITILSKNASISYNDIRLNIVDTPGHADFGGEVERILGTVDGAVLLVDAVEGPLPQTRFVLEKAISKGQKIILCINKVDRQEVKGDHSRIHQVVDKTFDLFLELGASEEQCDFPIIYACAREGWCCDKLEDVSSLVNGTKKGNLQPLFELLINYLEGPEVDADQEFCMQLSNLSWSEYVGQLAIGRVVAGKVKSQQRVYRLGLKAGSTTEAEIESFVVAKLYKYKGIQRFEV